ncbi:butyrophilin subfamily 3 member A2-like [Hyla sarda]|uniref:butyrophilin subfamily 3 member A2-like n=1 Tax=Hyla sarda TaxID=327740 RepID=UPI0024C3E552|nr:butyrophilin subfamily 3 member A2-like [Hyla sarda]
MMRTVLLVVVVLLTSSVVLGLEGLLSCPGGERMVSFPQDSIGALPCLFSPLRVSDQLMRVSWQKEHKMEDLVVHFQNGKDTGDKQNAIFKGRTTISNNWFADGNATLTLADLTEDDAGRYSCWITEYPIRPGRQVRCCVVTLHIFDRLLIQKNKSHGDDVSHSILDQVLAVCFCVLVLALLCFLPFFIHKNFYAKSKFTFSL